MYKLKEIAEKVYYVGVNDRQKVLFENMWPLPYGVSYNSYLGDSVSLRIYMPGVWGLNLFSRNQVIRRRFTKPYATSQPFCFACGYTSRKKPGNAKD